MNSPTLHHTARLLTNLGEGDSSAASELFPLVYQELRALAGSYLRRQRSDHTLQPTALVHEVYMKMVDQTGSSGARFNNRAHFMAVAAKAMRHILINHAEKRNAAKRGGGERAGRRLSIDADVAIQPDQDVDLLALDEALQRLSAMDDRKSRVVEARFFGGLTVDEIAVVLGVSKTTVEGDWRLARAWLSKELSKGSLS
jgi:RNA polymerase sigma-70 factor, ECF subfamily